MSKVDFVSKNMELTQMDQIDREREKIFKIRTVYQRLESAKYKKEEIEIDQMKKKLFLLHRWEIIKDKRSDMRADAI